MSVGKKKKEPLFHIVKRDALPWQKTWLIRVGAIAAAIIAVSYTHLTLPTTPYV